MSDQFYTSPMSPDQKTFRFLILGNQVERYHRPWAVMLETETSSPIDLVRENLGVKTAPGSSCFYP